MKNWAKRFHMGSKTSVHIQRNTSNRGLFPEVSESVRCAVTITASLYQGSDSSPQPAVHGLSSNHVDFEPMDPDAQRQKRREIVLSSLDVAIEASNLAQEFCSITPAKPVFAAFCVILTMIRVDFLPRRLH